jgi:hypothetical protein
MSSTASDEKVQGMILTTATLLANSPTLKLKEAMMMTGYTQKDIKDIANSTFRGNTLNYSRNAILAMSLYLVLKIGRIRGRSMTSKMLTMNHPK